jgi:hypothetical protein
MKLTKLILISVVFGFGTVAYSKADVQAPQIKVNNKLPEVVSEMTTLSVTVKDDSKLKYIVVNLNKENIGFYTSKDKTKKLKINLDRMAKKPLSNGKHELEIYAEDSAGNRSPVFIKNFEVKRFQQSSTM